MTNRLNNCSRNCRRGGLTLIEVVIGLLLLSTLLSSLLLSHQRHARQLQLAQRTLAAIDSADRLLADWFAERRRSTNRGQRRRAGKCCPVVGDFCFRHAAFGNFGCADGAGSDSGR